MSEFFTATLQTKLGLVQMKVTDGTSLFLEATLDEPIVVNGVPIRFTLHLEDYGNGFELRHNKGRPEYHHLSASKVNETDWRKTDASDAARKKILEVMTAAANEWKKDNKLSFQRAALEDVRKKMRSRQDTIKKLQQNLQEEWLAWEELKQQEAALLEQIAVAEKAAGK